MPFAVCSRWLCVGWDCNSTSWDLFCCSGAPKVSAVSAPRLPAVSTRLYYTGGCHTDVPGRPRLRGTSLYGYVSRMQSACRYVERNPMPQQDHLTARLVVDDDFEVAPVNNRLFGSFVEHLGRCVYTGIYEPDHPTATSTASARTSSTWSRNSAPPPSATRAATSCPATAGRTHRPQAGTSRRLDLPGIPPKPTNSACTEMAEWLEPPAATS